MTTPANLAAEPDTYRGHEGIRRYFDSFYDVMDEVRFRLNESGMLQGTRNRPDPS